MKTRQSEAMFLKVDVGGETVRGFGRPEELAGRLEASGYDFPASEVQAGLELDLLCLVVTGQGSSGYKIIEEFLPELPDRDNPQFRVRGAIASLAWIFADSNWDEQTDSELPMGNNYLGSNTERDDRFVLVD